LCIADSCKKICYRICYHFITIVNFLDRSAISYAIVPIKKEFALDDQSFGLIFFSEDSYVAFDKRLVAATGQNVRRAMDFVEKTTCHGSSDPIPALRAAFATDPEIIYFLTDGDMPNSQQILEEIHKLNAGRKTKVRVSTIAFMDRGEEYEKFLQRVASETGGYFRLFID